MNEQISEIEHLFLAFADKTRLQLLYILRGGEMSVNSLSDALNTSQPKVSRHLAYLRTMNVVTTRREGKNIYYKLEMPANTFRASVVEETIDWLGSLEGKSPGLKRSKTERPRVMSAPVPPPLFENAEQTHAEAVAEPEPEYSEREMEIYLL